MADQAAPEWAGQLPTTSRGGVGTKRENFHGICRRWPVFLPGKFQGQRSLAGYSPWSRKESDTTERLSTRIDDRFTDHHETCSATLALKRWIEEQGGMVSRSRLEPLWFEILNSELQNSLFTLRFITVEMRLMVMALIDDKTRFQGRTNLY